MKLTSLLLFLAPIAALAATEEKLNQHFAVQPGGTVVVDVDFGSINVNTNATSEIVVDVWRKVGRKSKADEDAFLRDNPVNIAQDGQTVTVRARGKNKSGWSWSGRNQTEGKYTITVPARFSAQLKTAGGGIEVNDLSGDVKANTSGGGLHFARLHGPLDGETSGGGIDVKDCEGKLKIHTSGGGIEVAGGSGSLDGDTSGGSVSVKTFHGPTRVETSGGGITIKDVVGQISGSTSGGSIKASLPVPVAEMVSLSTSGGGITVRIPDGAAFDLDAVTSAGSVSSELPVTVTGKKDSSRLKGPVNGGGKSIKLRSSAGSIHVYRSGSSSELESSSR